MTSNWKSYFKHLEWIPKYQFHRDLKFDLIAGITVAMMIIPQEISLANIMHVPPQYGLYTAALTPVLYALFGTSRVLSVANGSEVSLMVGAALQSISSEKERIAVGIFLSFFIGMINLLLGFLRLGVIADFFSRPVMGGFLSGGGILIMMSQFGTWFQLTLPPSTYPIETIINIIKQFKDSNTNSVAVGAGSIVFLSLLKYAKKHWIPAPNLSQILEAPTNNEIVQLLHESLASVQTPTDANNPTWAFSLNEQDYAALEPVQPLKKVIPHTQTKRRLLIYFVLRTVCDMGPLVVCLFGILVGRYLGEKNIKVTGHVPNGLPAPVLPWYGYTQGIIKSVNFSDISLNAASIALIVYMTSIAMAKRLAIRDRYDVNPTNEFVGLGMASAIGSFFQIMPPTGGMSRTAVNMQSARTQLASAVTVSIVILVLLVGTDTLYYLPKASLASIIIVAGFWLIEIEEAQWLFRSKRDEFYVWVASFVLTIALGILPGLGASIVCSLLAVMIKTKRPQVYLLGRVETDYGSKYDKAQDSPDAIVDSDLLVVRIEGSLYFGNSENATQMILSLVAAHGGTRGIIVDATYVHDMDATTIQVLETLQMKLSNQNVGLAIANSQTHLAHVLKASGLCELLVVHEVNESIDQTVARVRALEHPEER